MHDSLSPRALVELDDVRAFVNPEAPDDTSGDDSLVQMINAFSEQFQDEARREIVAVNATRNEEGQVEAEPEVRVFDGDLAVCGWKGAELAVGDLADLDSVKIDGATIADADVVALPRTRQEWEPITRLRFPRRRIGWTAVVEVEGTWGFPRIPERVRQAAREEIKEWAKGDRPLSDTYLAEGGRLIAHSMSSAAFEVARKLRNTGGVVSLRVG